MGLHRALMLAVATVAFVAMVAPATAHALVDKPSNSLSPPQQNAAAPTPQTSTSASSQPTQGTPAQSPSSAPPSSAPPSQSPSSAPPSSAPPSQSPSSTPPSPTPSSAPPSQSPPSPSSGSTTGQSGSDKGKTEEKTQLTTDSNQQGNNKPPTPTAPTQESASNKPPTPTPPQAQEKANGNKPPTPTPPQAQEKANGNKPPTPTPPQAQEKANGNKPPTPTPPQAQEKANSKPATPPGQAKKADTPPGQAKKQTSEAASKPSPPPGQVKPATPAAPAPKPATPAPPSDLSSFGTVTSTKAASTSTTPAPAPAPAPPALTNEQLVQMAVAANEASAAKNPSFKNTNSAALWSQIVSVRSRVSGFTKFLKLGSPRFTEDATVSGSAPNQVLKCKFGTSENKSIHAIDNSALAAWAAAAKTLMSNEGYLLLVLDISGASFSQPSLTPFAALCDVGTNVLYNPNQADTAKALVTQCPKWDTTTTDGSPSVTTVVSG